MLLGFLFGIIMPHQGSSKRRLATRHKVQVTQLMVAGVIAAAMKPVNATDFFTCNDDILRARSSFQSMEVSYELSLLCGTQPTSHNDGSISWGSKEECDSCIGFLSYDWKLYCLSSSGKYYIATLDCSSAISGLNDWYLTRFYVASGVDYASGNVPLYGIDNGECSDALPQGVPSPMCKIPYMNTLVEDASTDASTDDCENDPDCIKGIYADEWFYDLLNPLYNSITIGGVFGLGVIGYTCSRKALYIGKALCMLMVSAWFFLSIYFITDGINDYMTKDFHCCNCCTGDGVSGFFDDDGWITPPDPYFCEVCPPHEYSLLSDDPGNFQSIVYKVLLGLFYSISLIVELYAFIKSLQFGYADLRDAQLLLDSIKLEKEAELMALKAQTAGKAAQDIRRMMSSSDQEALSEVQELHTKLEKESKNDTDNSMELENSSVNQNTLSELFKERGRERWRISIAKFAARLLALGFLLPVSLFDMSGMCASFDITPQIYKRSGCSIDAESVAKNIDMSDVLKMYVVINILFSVGFLCVVIPYILLKDPELRKDENHETRETMISIMKLGALLLVISVLISAGLAAMGMIMGDSTKGMNVSSLMMFAWQITEWIISWVMAKPWAAEPVFVASCAARRRRHDAEKTHAEAAVMVSRAQKGVQEWAIANEQKQLKCQYVSTDGRKCNGQRFIFHNGTHAESKFCELHTCPTCRLNGKSSSTTKCIRCTTKILASRSTRSKVGSKLRKAAPAKNRPRNAMTNNPMFLPQDSQEHRSPVVTRDDNLAATNIVRAQTPAAHKTNATKTPLRGRQAYNGDHRIPADYRASSGDRRAPAYVPPPAFGSDGNQSRENGKPKSGGKTLGDRIFDHYYNQ